jgi:CheY-like chemotaxis protein/anti-sigma regulatory factor (Ser/Thr protein kinase)
LDADATGFEQVLANLIGNALHASPRGGTVRVTVQERSNGLSIEVLDQGAGVPVGDRSRIFEPFWTTRAHGEGLGLGLAVVDSIVRAHGGRVEVEDAPGGGARFCVHWPWRPLRASVAQPPTTTSSTAPGRARLLVIDDEPLVRAMIGRQASAEGYEVVEAESGDQALELLLTDGAEFSAIVCDLRMPGTSGADFYDHLAQRAPRWLSRLLFVTGDLASNESAAFAERCRAPILTKPFTAVDLMRRVRSVQNTG